MAETALDTQEKEPGFHDNTCVARSLDSMINTISDGQIRLSPEARKVRQEILEDIHSGNNPIGSALEADQKMIPEMFNLLASEQSPDPELANLLLDTDIVFTKGNKDDVNEAIDAGYEVSYVTVRPSKKNEALVPHIFHIKKDGQGKLVNMSDYESRTKKSSEFNLQEDQDYDMQLESDFQMGQFLEDDVDWNMIMMKKKV